MLTNLFASLQFDLPPDSSWKFPWPNPEAIQVPCNEPCSKCGSLDINRVYRAKDSAWDRQGDDRREFSTKYVTFDRWRCYSLKDHLEHHCRCCQHDWQTLPLDKQKAKTK